MYCSLCFVFCIVCLCSVLKSEAGQSLAFFLQKSSFRCQLLITRSKNVSNRYRDGHDGDGRDDDDDDDGYDEDGHGGYDDDDGHAIS